MTLDLSAYLQPVRDIAVEAGECILEVYQRDFQVESKQDDSPLTEADLASHRHIVSALKALTPDIPILSEESAAEVPTAVRLGWDRFWLVDPLDGTKEFIKRNGEFTVNIAYVEGHTPVLGVVHVPAEGVTYSGARDLGAVRREADGSERAIRVAAMAGHPARVVGSRSHAGEHIEAYVSALGDHEFLARGSSLKLCLVAEGAADVYPRFGLTSEWDTAAAQAVVTSAGGRVVDLRGRPLQCNRGESILNPYFMVIGDSDFDWFSGIPTALLDLADA
jgi:3'(2'), 5'-bisphosphate nucleotidase